MSACDDFEDTLRTFFSIVNTDPPSRPLHTDEEIGELFERSVDRAKRFYVEFAHTTETLTQCLHASTSKVYMRLYKPTGHWYIGCTDREFAEDRHEEDLCASVSKNSSKLHKFYNQVLRKDKSHRDNIVVYTIAELMMDERRRSVLRRLASHTERTIRAKGAPMMRPRIVVL